MSLSPSEAGSHLTGRVGRPCAVCAAAGPYVRAPGALEGAQTPGVVQGAVAWTRETRDDSDTHQLIPGTPGQKGVTWPETPATCSVHRGWSVQLPSS